MQSEPSQPGISHSYHIRADAVDAVLCHAGGRALVVPYAPPGDPALAEAVGRRAAESRAILLAHHGPVVAGTSLDDAADAASVDALRVRPS